MERGSLDIRRTTQEAAAEAVWSLSRELIEDGTTYIFRPDASREEVVRYWFPDPGVTYLATVDDEPVGCYLVRPNQPGRGSHVANASYFVSTRRRGRGFGRALCEHSMDVAREEGYRALIFNLVVSTNTGAIELWKTLGFETLGTIPLAFDHAEQGLVDALVMHRRL
jgi:ribosomal protein S18 acetylase RimI-like enzyme